MRRILLFSLLAACAASAPGAAFPDAGKLTMPQATRLAEISRVEFEEALLERGLPLLRLDERYWAQEVQSLERLEL